MRDYKDSSVATLPFGSLLLDRASAQFSTRLSLLSQIQEVFDDFILDDNKQTQVDSKLAILYSVESSDSNPAVIPPLVQEFAQVAQEFFEVSLLDISLLENFNGRFGDFEVRFSNGAVVGFAQAVLFVQNDDLMRFRGVYNVADFKDSNTLLNTLKQNLGSYTYKDIVSFKEDVCQYHHRREKYCTKCAEVCPTFGIATNDSLMELILSPVDCISCGACVGVCPTNCLEYEELPKESLEEILELIGAQKIMLCSIEGYEHLSAQGVILPDDVIPLVLPNLLLLNENDLLTMVQSSGYALLIFDEFLSAPMQFLNNITQQIYKHDCAVLTNIESLPMLAQTLLQVETYLYKNRYNKPFRESFAQRLQYMIKENNYGIAKSILNEDSSVAPVFYGDLKVDSSKCTLCLSCVGACNVNAIFARSDDFSLRFNPSLCTTCGYCVTSCPENIMEVTREGILLDSSYFKSREIAKDEPFLCVECGKVFSTKKSIDKVMAMLSASFSGDSKKLRTLQCCPDCKVRVMFGNAKGEVHA